MAIFFVSLKGLMRDRVLHGLAGVALLLLVGVPVFSQFSMRQVQELATSLSLSAISLVLLVVSVLYGASSIWRDIERRYIASVAGLPVSRRAYVLGKFFGIAAFLALCALVLGGISLLVIPLSAASYPGEFPLSQGNLVLAVGASTLKYILLAAFAMVLSSLSTSFFLPIFGTLAIYFAGGASQGVMDYLGGAAGEKVPPLGKALCQGLYYLLPNFSAFDFHVYAIYGLTIPLLDLAFTLGYFLLYTAILLFWAIWLFERRELP